MKQESNMMIGNNELRFNLATMQKIIQHYLDQEMFQSSVKVVSVSFLSTDHMVSVTVEGGAIKREAT